MHRHHRRRLRNAGRPRQRRKVRQALLAVGRYRVIERVSLVLVGTFVGVTLLALLLLQFDPAWAISGAEFASGAVPSIGPATPSTFRMGGVPSMR